MIICLGERIAIRDVGGWEEGVVFMGYSSTYSEENRVVDVAKGVVFGKALV